MRGMQTEGNQTHKGNLKERGRVMNARAYLEQVEKIDKLIQNKKYEHEQWESIAEGTSVSSDGERVQSSGEMHKMENAAIMAVELENEINRLKKQKAEIIATIETLSANSYDILHKKYIQHLSLGEIADKYGYAWSTIKNKHREALNQLQKVLDKRSKNGK